MLFVEIMIVYYKHNMKQAYKYLEKKIQDVTYSGKEALKVLSGIFLFIYISLCCFTPYC